MLVLSQSGVQEDARQTLPTPGRPYDKSASWEPRENRVLIFTGGLNARGLGDLAWPPEMLQISGSDVKTNTIEVGAWVPANSRDQVWRGSQENHKPDEGSWETKEKYFLSARGMSAATSNVISSSHSTCS
jgi:hypothetical protein